MSQLFVLVAILATLFSPSAQAGAVKDIAFSAGAPAGPDLMFGMPVGSPTARASIELGGRSLRWYTSLESSPTLLHSISFDMAGIPMIMLSSGPTFGTEDFRVGPYVSAGLVAAGAGIRVAHATREGKRGGKHGWEARASYTYSSTVSTSLLYSWHLPMNKR